MDAFIRGEIIMQVDLIRREMHDVKMETHKLAQIYCALAVIEDLVIAEVPSTVVS